MELVSKIQDLASMHMSLTLGLDMSSRELATCECAWAWGAWGVHTCGAGCCMV